MMLKIKITVISKRIDGTLRDVDKSAIHANAITAYVPVHRNFMITGLYDRFKGKQYNLDLNSTEQGYYRSFYNLMKSLKKGGKYSLKQLLADYQNMDEYEQYGVRRVMYDMVLMLASTSVALTLASLVDGDDDYDNWLMQSVTYLALRSAFEFRTMYNPMEFKNMVKSPTAAFTLIDNASSFIELFNPFAYVGDKGVLSKVKEEYIRIIQRY